MSVQPLSTTPNQSGNIIAVTAFILWGLFPLYFKELIAYDSAEIIVHRFFWTGILAFTILLFSRFVRGTNWDWLTIIKREPKWLFWLLATACLMFINTFTYVWAVNHDKVLEASFGYFICPLVAIVLAMVFLGERLNRWQAVAVVFAVFGVLLQLVLLGFLPTVALVVSFSFAFYGLLHKQMPILAIPALFLETLMVSPFLLLWLFNQDHASSQVAFWTASNPQLWLLALAGPVTLIPLTLYNIAIKRTTMTAVSFLGYITPSMVFVLAVFLYKEELQMTKLWSFVLIWLGLLVFSLDLFKRAKSPAV